jgi:excisionase family DNA binding protein
MRLLSTREMADALGVSESSLKRWVDSGRISASRTEGGHRRIELGEAMRFIRRTGSPVVRPDLLDLPEAAAGTGKRLVDHLLAGDAASAGGWLVARFLEGATLAELADGPIRSAMYALGELWHHDEGGIFIEHRGTDACLHAIAQLRGMIAKVPDRAPVAIGGAPAGDPYLIPSQLASMVAAEVGMNAINLGADTPIAAFAAAVTRHRPRLVSLSISTPLASARARALSRWLGTLPASTSIIIGGRSASTLATVPPRTRRATSMFELADKARVVVDRAA